LCNDVGLFKSCLTKEKIAIYASKLALFLVELGCEDADIARGLAGARINYYSEYPIQRAFAKELAEIGKKDCPGWAALPAEIKAELKSLMAK
jgi:hypothetical protein